MARMKNKVHHSLSSVMNFNKVMNIISLISDFKNSDPSTDSIN